MDFCRLREGIISAPRMAGVSCFMKFAFFEKNIKIFQISKSGKVGGCWSPQGWSLCVPNYGRYLVNSEICKMFKKIKKNLNLEILDCSGCSLALMNGSAAVPKSSLLPGKCFSKPSKFAFLDVGSLRIRAQHRPNALPTQMRTVRLVGEPNRSRADPSRADPIRAKPS